jgi:hypothetical protein
MRCSRCRLRRRAKRPCLPWAESSPALGLQPLQQKGVAADDLQPHSCVGPLR